LARLLLVRHGRTEFNHDHKFVGHTNIDMSPEGYRQIEKLRDRLALVKIDAACSSDLLRARSTTGIITSGRKINISTCSELRELNYGQLEGLTFDEIMLNSPETGKAMIDRSCLISFPGGECFNDLETRVRLFIKDLSKYSAEETVLVVGHSGPLTLLVCFLLGASKETWWHLHMDNASLSIIDTYKEGAILNLFNDVSHLGRKINGIS
jgi:alpha-ribazole phosphatase